MQSLMPGAFRLRACKRKVHNLRLVCYYQNENYFFCAVRSSRIAFRRSQFAVRMLKIIDPGNGSGALRTPRRATLMVGPLEQLASDGDATVQAKNTAGGLDTARCQQGNQCSVLGSQCSILISQTCVPVPCRARLLCFWLEPLRPHHWPAAPRGPPSKSLPVVS